MREQKLPRDRLREITIGLLDQQTICEIHHVATESQSIRVTPGVFDQACEAQKVRRLPDLIECYVGEREIDLKRRRVAAPFAKPLAEDERVIAKAQRVGCERVH
jgi:hypothetical protein